MNEASEVQWLEGDVSATDGPEIASAGTRRRLLAGAGGLALAGAGGLFLPEWLEEAEAANSPVRRLQQRKERKRERRRNQSHGGHDRNRRQDKGRGGSPFRGVEINFSSYSFPTVDVEFWVHEPFIWRKKESHPSARGEYFFGTDNLEALILINGKFCVEVHNYPVGTPDISLGVDGSVRERGGWHPGLTVLPPTAVSEREDLPPTTVQGVKFELGRHADDPSYINFKVAMWKA